MNVINVHGEKVKITSCTFLTRHEKGLILQI